jgi:hypothetical protein
VMPAARGRQVCGAKKKPPAVPRASDGKGDLDTPGRKTGMEFFLSEDGAAALLTSIADTLDIQG